MSWPSLSALQVTVSLYAAALLRSGEEGAAAVTDPLSEAGSAAADALSEALTRIQDWPAEAWAGLGDLLSGLTALFPEEAPAAEPPASSAERGGQAGAIARTARPGTGGTRWRGPVDAAGLARFLRERHPSKTAIHVAALSGVPVDTVAKLLAREALPSGRTLLALICVYGPELLAAVLPGANPRWLEGARILADQARLEAELARTRAEMAANTARWSFCGITFGGAP
ncbi:hypothetical protein [Methylobacterium sp. JK268]